MPKKELQHEENFIDTVRKERFGPFGIISTEKIYNKT